MELVVEIGLDLVRLEVQVGDVLERRARLHKADAVGVGNGEGYVVHRRRAAFYDFVITLLVDPVNLERAGR